jgi:hypothetical protein
MQNETGMSVDVMISPRHLALDGAATERLDLAPARGTRRIVCAKAHAETVTIGEAGAGEPSGQARRLVSSAQRQTGTAGKPARLMECSSQTRMERRLEQRLWWPRCSGRQRQTKGQSGWQERHLVRATARYCQRRTEWQKEQRGSSRTPRRSRHRQSQSPCQTRSWNRSRCRARWRRGRSGGAKAGRRVV